MRVKASNLRRKPAETSAKTKAIYDHLRDLAYRRGPEVKLPTVKELCSTLTTSQATLNDVLGDLEAHNIICRRKGSGIYVSPTIHRKRISVLLSYTYFRLPGAPPFWNMLYHMFTLEAERRSQLRELDYEFVFQSGGRDGTISQDRLVAAANRGEIQGIVEIATGASTLGHLLNRKFPVVGYALPGDWLVMHDTQELIRLGVQSLWEQGCRRIGYWSPRLSLSADDKITYDGNLHWLERTIEDMGGSLNPEDCLRVTDICDVDGDFGTYQEQGYRIAMKVFSGSSPIPDGILIPDDMATSGVIAAAYKLGIRLGKDIRVATGANFGSTVLHCYEEYLTLIEYSPERIVHALCDMVETLVEGKVPDRQHVYIKPTIRNISG